MIEVLVRPMEERDVRAVSEVRVRTWQVAYAGIVPQGFLDAMSVQADYERRRVYFHDPDQVAEVYVAHVAGRVVGFVVIGPSRDDDAGGAGEVYALYVLPEQHGTGTGTRLIDRAIERLGELGYARLTLWVLEDNSKARRFYEKSGFRPDGAHHLFTAGRELPEVRYARPAS